MPKHFVGRSGRHCTFYQEITGKVQSNFICVGDKDWPPCVDLKFCLAWETRKKKGQTDEPKKRRGRKPKTEDPEEIEQAVNA